MHPGLVKWETGALLLLRSASPKIQRLEFFRDSLMGKGMGAADSLSSECDHRDVDNGPCVLTWLLGRGHKTSCMKNCGSGWSY